MPPTVVTPLRRAFITLFAVMSGLMQTVDSTIANVALPHMQGTMGATQDQIAWVLTSYMVASAIGLMLTTAAVERFGRTRVFAIAIGTFTLASMLCGTAQSLSQIVLFRLLQGFLGGAMVPLSQAVMIDTYPPDRRTFAMSIWGMGSLVGPILGPTLGGYLTDAYNWRWVFFINLPFGTLAAVGIALALPETVRTPGRYFDKLGFALLTIAVGALQIMVDRGETLDWFSSTEIDIEAIVAVVAFYLFIVHILTTERPFISRVLFRDKNFVIATLLTCVIGATLFSTSALMPLMLQSLMNYPPQAAGLIMATRGLGAVIGMVLLNRFSRFSPRVFMIAGTLIAGFASLRFASFTVDVGAREIQIAGAFMGFGLAVSLTPLTVLAFGTLDPKLTTEASALGSLGRNVFGSMGISALVALLATNSQVNHQVLTEHVTVFSRSIQDLAAHTILTLNSPAGLALLDGAVNRDAAMRAYVDDFLLVALCSILALPFVFLVRTGTRAAGPSEPIPHEL